MKIVVGYPPTKSEKGIALLSQNRQFQWFSNPTKMFPVVLASAATQLKNKGYEVRWKDCIAEETSWNQFIRFLKKEKPDYFIFETKTPVIKQHWKTVDKLKDRFPEMKIIILGDHVTYLPKESMEKSKVDFVICGGDYDFMLVDLFSALDKKKKIPSGIFYRKAEKILGNKKFKTNYN